MIFTPPANLRYPEIDVQTPEADTSLNGQSVDHECISIISGFLGPAAASPTSYRIRIRIRSDSIKDQCHATCQIWSARDLTWHSVATMPKGVMNTPPGLCHRKDWDDPTRFDADFEWLIARAKLTVFGVR